MKKIPVLFALGAVAIFGIYACITSNSSSGGSGSNNVSLQITIDVMSNTAPAGVAPGKIITRTIESNCDSTVVVKDTSMDTSFYSIAGGKLYVWHANDCVAGSLTGTSPTIVGTWTSTSVGGDNPGERVLVPATYRASSCPSTLPPDSSNNNSLPLENGSVTITIAAATINEQLSGDLCWAGKIYGDTANHPFGPTVKVTSAGCGSVVLTNSTNQKTLTVTSSVQSNTLSISLASGGKTCTSSSMSLNLPGTTPDCSQNTHAADSVFESCSYGLDTAFANVAYATSPKVSAYASSHHPWWKLH